MRLLEVPIWIYLFIFSLEFDVWCILILECSFEEKEIKQKVIYLSKMHNVYFNI